MPTKKTTSGSNLLDHFLGEYVVAFLTEMNTIVASEDGDQAEIPLVVEGMFYDYDADFILLGNEEKTAFTLLNKKNVGKIDTVDEKQASTSQVNPRDMN